jgi:Spy/CpxP family protein refolding chaperone
MSMSSENVPKKRRGMALGLAALLFVTGVAAGVAVDRLVDRDRARSGEGRGWRGRLPEATARKYRDRLDLDDAQTARVEAVLRRTWTATREVIGPMEPKIDAIRQQGDREIRALLRPEQAARFDEMVADRQRRREEMRKGLDLSERPDRR